jgi:hypothetical protein
MLKSSFKFPSIILPVYRVDAGEHSGCSVELADFFGAQRQRSRRYVLFQMGNGYQESAE